MARVFTMVRRIIEASPLLKREAKITADRITFPGIDATIAAIASDAGSAAGSQRTISVFDELWAYTSERARRLWDEMVPPPTRKIACRFTCTYAGYKAKVDCSKSCTSADCSSLSSAPTSTLATACSCSGATCRLRRGRTRLGSRRCATSAPAPISAWCSTSSPAARASLST